MLPLFHYNKTKIELFSKTGGKEENPYLPPEKIDTKTGGKGLYIDIAAANNVGLVE